MGIETSMYNNLLHPPKSVAEYDAEAMQGQTNRLALQMNQAKIADHQRGVERGNRLTNMLGSFAPGMSAADQGDTLTRGGFIDEGRKVIESGAKVSKDQREGERAQREAEKFQGEKAREHFAFLGQVISSAKDQASYSQGLQAIAARGIDVSQIPAQFDPAYVANAGQQTMTELQRIERDIKERTFGETVRNNKEQTSVQVRGQNMTSSTAAAGRAVTVRGQNMTDARSKESNGMAGKAPPGYRFNPDGSMSAIAGGPADLKNGAEAVKKVSEAKDVLSLLDEADALLPKGTSGYIGTGVDKALGAAGVSTAGGQATAQLKAIEGALISKMPKMSGPQSDKDVLLYKQMAGQVGDSTIPREQRQAASGLIRKLNEKYAGMAAGSSKPAAGAFSDAEKERRYQEFKAKQGK